MGHTSFIAAGETDRQAMLRAIGVGSCDELFSQIPSNLRTKSFELPAGISEHEMTQNLLHQAQLNNTGLINFCGAGYYDHFIPAAVTALTNRGEFSTAYTPYQPEASQGTLQAIYEYQTAIVRLTDMEVANASLYDGGTALFEAIMMALRITGRKRILIDEGVNPLHRSIVQCQSRNLPIEYEEISLNDGIANRQLYTEKLDESVAAVVVQNPNFFGCLDDFSDLAKVAHRQGTLLISSIYPISLGLIKTPGSMDADIVVGEGQSLGLPLSFGGPYLGFMATRKTFVRKMPGRIVGATHDAQGRHGYVLTLQAREQHIRREKATSNICSNEALCALRAVIYLSLIGRQGLIDLAKTSAARATYAWEKLTKIRGITPTFKQPFFNEIALNLPLPAADVSKLLLEKGIAAGFPMERYYPKYKNVLLLAFTEKRSRSQIDLLAKTLEGLKLNP